MVPERTLLLDLHNTLADFNAGFEIRWAREYQGIPPVKIANRKSPRVVDDYPREYDAMVRKIYSAPGFLTNLPPVPGAVEAVNELESKYRVYICTKPSTSNPLSIVEKMSWVLNHLGSRWADRIIFAEDKTMVRGDILVDDAPAIEGIFKPVWEHVIFDLPYNRKVLERRRLNWDNWREVLT